MKLKERIARESERLTRTRFGEKYAVELIRGRYIFVDGVICTDPERLVEDHQRVTTPIIIAKASDLAPTTYKGKSKLTEEELFIEAEKTRKAHAEQHRKET